MKNFLLSILCPGLCLFLFACEKQEPLVYNVNKSDELQEYESELEAESAFEESKVQESIAESEALLAEQIAMEANLWHKKKVEKDRVEVKGIYLTDAVAGSAKMDEIISHIVETELNAVVIDIKGDHGTLACVMEDTALVGIAESTNNISNLGDLLWRLHSDGIYAIARLVCFRDPHMAKVHPEWMNTLSDGSVFYDNSNMPWVNPYKREYWEYMAKVAEHCIDAGFDEIQLDYVRFCTEKGMNDVVYTDEDTGGLDKTEIIGEFIRFMSDRVASKGAFFSVDVFGTIIGSYVDSVSVGQDYVALSECVDYMCPMIYPSHYGNGNFGIEHPDTEPYRTIQGALSASKKELEKPTGAQNRTAARKTNKEGADVDLGIGMSADIESTDGNVGDDKAIVRPWLQGFTASWLVNYIKYGPDEIRSQIQAVYDSGYSEWLIWSASNNYDWEAFRYAGQ